jgi:molybdenum cofactor cytidylyltransferase
MKICAIVLASGQSKRIGINKLLLDIGGQTLVERVVHVLLQSQVDQVIVVVGFDGKRVRDRFKREDVRVVYNRRYREGMAASIREGLRHVARDSHGVLIVLADHPLLTSQLVDQIIHAYRETRKGIVCPTHEGKRGHPVVFNLKKYGKALSQLRGDIGGREVIGAHGDDVLEFAVDSPAVIRDIDSWEDYEESCRLIAEKADRKEEEGKGRR